MRADLERDFGVQQALLLALLKERAGVIDKSRAAGLDLQIERAQNLVRSYQVVKWHEQQP